MSRESSPGPIHSDRSSPEPNSQNEAPDPKTNTSTSKYDAPAPPITRSNRPSRACTIRAAARLYATSQATADHKPKPTKKEQQRGCEDSAHQPQQCSKIITQLVDPPEPFQLPRWNIRSMWELASVLNFLHIFRAVLNISTEFSAEEFETALITPNDTLSDIHMPLLKAIPPITRMALTRDTWITVLCRKLRDWWHWVADGELPIVASHGVEIETYKLLDPGIRVVILKALCDIRVEQEDIRSYIDNSLKHGVQLLSFRKERIGGDAQGISYWYEDDPIMGHRLYREIRKTEVKKAKTKGSNILPCTTYLWETVATNFDEFEDVSEKLFASKNRTEASLGKKLKIEMLPQIEKVHKKKERLLKKQHRQALLLDNFLGIDGLAAGRSLRDRKPVTYTFDDYDRSINEAIKITKKKQPSPEPLPRREAPVKPASLTNGRSGPSHTPQYMNFYVSSPTSPESDDAEDEHKNEVLDRSNRRRRRSTRYSVKDFVEAVSDNEADFDSDDDIVGEAIYDEEYLRKRKQRRKFSSSSEGDDEYRWEEENAEGEDDEDSMNISDESDEPHKVKKLPGRTKRETKSRSVHDFHSGLRRSKRASRNHINYRQYEFSESETESMKPQKSNHSDECFNETENGDFPMESQPSDGNVDEEEDIKMDQSADDDEEENKIDRSAEVNPSTTDKDQRRPPEKKTDHPEHEELDEGMGRRRFLDLNELAPATGFDDCPNTVKDEDNNNF